MRRSCLGFPTSSRIGLGLGLITLVCLVVCGGIRARDGALAQTGPISEHDALERVGRFLGTDASDWRVKYRLHDCYVFEDPEATHHVKVSKTDGSIKAYHTRKAHRTPRQPRAHLTLERSQQLALGYVSRSGAGLSVRVLEPREQEFDANELRFRFLFTSYRGHVELPVRVEVELDATTGEVVDYLAVVHLPVRVGLQPTISRERAIAVATKASRLEAPQAVAAQLFVWPAYWLMKNPDEPLPQEQGLLWRVTVKGLCEEQVPTALHGSVPLKRESTEEMHIDAHTGDVRLSERVAEEDERSVRQQLPPEPRHYSVFDQSPAWASSDMLYFSTTRSTPSDTPDYHRPERCTSIFRLDLETGQISSVIADAFTFAPSYPAPSPDGRYLAFTYVRNTGLLDLRTGAIGRIGHHREGGQDAAWHPSGGQLAVTANRRGSQDIFGIDLDLGNLRSRAFSPVSEMEANQQLPVFGPKGTWLAFVAEQYDEPMKPKYSVCVIELDDDGLPAGSARTIIHDIPQPTSLSAFPDGARLLVCHDGGLDILDVDTGEKSAVHWPELRDPELLQGQPLIIRGAVLCPDGDRVAFSGLRWSGEPEDPAGWYIYVCNLDGSELQRVTPLEDEPVPPYVFPETGKTAFDVAKDIRAKFAE